MNQENSTQKLNKKEGNLLAELQKILAGQGATIGEQIHHNLSQTRYYHNRHL